jgi:hypothetical protein
MKKITLLTELIIFKIFVIISLSIYFNLYSPPFCDEKTPSLAVCLLRWTKSSPLRSNYLPR